MSSCTRKMYGGGMIESLRRRQKNLNALRVRGAPQSEINAMAKQVANLNRNIKIKNGAKKQLTSVFQQIKNIVPVIGNNTQTTVAQASAAVNKSENLLKLANRANTLAKNIRNMTKMAGGRRRRRTRRRRN